MRALDLAGKRFHRLQVIARTKNRGRNVMWSCKCDCGIAIDVSSSSLSSGKNKSCGCFRREAMSQFRHGSVNTPEYNTWSSMLRRCNNANNRSYPRYGGRGIRVCDQWNDFVGFLRDMGRKPSPDHSLDRIDNNGNYEPGNCRWATRVQQSRNSTNFKGGSESSSRPELAEDIFRLERENAKLIARIRELERCLDGAVNIARMRPAWGSEIDDMLHVLAKGIP